MKYEFKGTKGNWQAMEAAKIGSMLNTAVVTDSDEMICTDSKGVKKVDENEMNANAHLIAAAPDLLQAAVKALSDYPASDSTYQLLESAIKKALNIK